MHSQPGQLARQSLTVVMPCLNEEKNVGDAARATLRAFDHYGIDGELLIVNDGSSDGTQNVIDELARLDARVRPLWHEVRQGIGASFHHGVREALQRGVHEAGVAQVAKPHQARTRTLSRPPVAAVAQPSQGIGTHGPGRAPAGSARRSSR